jgi:outer membrane protein assembly factor BamE (lipoprotein component of BamABCDE complex)
MSRINFKACLRGGTTAAVLALCLVFSACAQKINRDDFATLLKSKTEEDVLKNMGKPSAVDNQTAERHLWTYNERTFDVNNHNKVDDKTVVIFTPSADGKMVVAEVKFE